MTFTHTYICTHIYDTCAVPTPRALKRWCTGCVCLRACVYVCVCLFVSVFLWRMLSSTSSDTHTCANSGAPATKNVKSAKGAKATVEGMGDGRGGLSAEDGFAEIFAALETDVLLLEGKVCWCACAICLKLKYTATHCNTLPHTATHCHALQHYLVCLGPMCSCSRRRCIYVLIQIATNYNILQHTATHCHALQYIVIHCNTTWCAWH